MSSRTLFIGLHFMPTSPTTIVFQTYDLQSDQQTIESFIFDIKTHAPNAPERFFSKICGIADLTKVKAISFMFIDFHWFSNFEEAYGFRLKCKTFCETNGIFYYFTTASTIQNYCALASTKTMVENGQKVSILELNPLGTITGTTVIRHNGGYHFYETLSAQKLDFTEEWKKKFIGNSNPTKVIFKPGAKNQHILEKLKEVFKDENPVISEDCVINFSKYTADHVLHVMGEKSDPYHFVNHCLNSFRVTLSPGDWNGAYGIM
uniref:Uncharacterized protein n=1 Tax=Panagrolaimus superbus TaxID=310955 RepID=A0A914YFG1_9BILA